MPARRRCGDVSSGRESGTVVPLQRRGGGGGNDVTAASTMTWRRGAHGTYGQTRGPVGVWGGGGSTQQLCSSSSRSLIGTKVPRRSPGETASLTRRTRQSQGSPPSPEARQCHPKSGAMGVRNPPQKYFFFVGGACVGAARPQVQISGGVRQRVRRPVWHRRGSKSLLLGHD